VVDGTVDGIVVTDAAGMVRLCNRAMRQMADGEQDGDWIGSPVTERLCEGPWQEPGVHDVPRPGGGVWRVSVAEVEAPDAFEGRDAVAQSRLFVAVAHDVTAAHKAARARDDMLAIVSHELKTPLTPIKVGATLLHRRWQGMDEPVREQMLAEIAGRADHLHRLIDDLLLVAQLPGSPHTLVQVTPMDFRETVERTVSTVAGMWPHHDVRVSGVEAAPGRSDPGRLRQVVAHLVDNACKFSPAEAPVDVRVETADDGAGPTACVTVTDRGCGIPAREHERVFERFARVEDPLVMTTGGAGLGLYIVRELVVALGGEVVLDSGVGRGTTVTVRLPMLSRTAPASGGERALTTAAVGDSAAAG
jgi:signal transduction histidine kinase